MRPAGRTNEDAPPSVGALPLHISRRSAYHSLDTLRGKLLPKLFVAQPVVLVAPNRVWVLIDTRLTKNLAQEI